MMRCVMCGGSETYCVIEWVVSRGPQRGEFCRDCAPKMQTMAGDRHALTFSPVERVYDGQKDGLTESVLRHAEEV